MLPIENGNYGMLSTFQPGYLAHLITDDGGQAKPATNDADSAPESAWSVLAQYWRTLLNK